MFISFLWILNSPVLSTNTTEECIKFVDNIVRTDLPDPDKEPELHKLFSQYQIHAHFNSCVSINISFVAFTLEDVLQKRQ